MTFLSGFNAVGVVDGFVQRLADGEDEPDDGKQDQGAHGFETCVRVALQQGTITWLPQVDTTRRHSSFLVRSLDHDFVPRGPLEDGTVRKIDCLCDQEIEAGMIRVVQSMVGVSKAEAVVATARAFGYERTGQYVEQRMAMAVERLLAKGGLIERVGSLVLPDRT